MPTPSRSQLDFDQKYITATEIAKLLGVSRTAVHHARRKGILPNPILIGSDMLYIWEREFIRPHIDVWKIQLNTRRGLPA